MVSRGIGRVMVYNCIILNFMLEVKIKPFTYSMKTYDGSSSCNDVVGKEVITGRY